MMLENMDPRELARDRVYEFLYLKLTERIRGATGRPCGQSRSADQLALCNIATPMRRSNAATLIESVSGATGGAVA
jgi:hypothetical protein